MSEKTELAIIELPEASQLFDGTGIDPILEAIERKARGYDLDVTTESGRKEIASVAYKVAKSKTAIDAAGKDLVSGIKEKAKVIDSERKKARDFLDSLKEEIRKPLTDFENAEKERVASLESRLFALSSVLDEIPETSAEISKLIERVSITDPETFEEFSSKAAATMQVVSTKLAEALDKAKASEAEKAELERLRAEQAERERIEREERLKKEAAEAAKREAEAKAEAERKEIERKHEAEIAKQKAEAEAKERKIREEQEAEEEAAKARREAEAKRVANKRHRAKVRKDTVDAINSLTIDGADIGAAIFEAIEAGEIPNLEVQY